jgi:hypothetical protein
MATEILLKIPEKYKITPPLIEEFKLLNLDLAIQQAPENSIILSEYGYKWDDYEFVELKFPTNIFPDSNFDELYEINIENKQVNFEQPGNHSIIFKMGTFDTISLITGAIFASIYFWAKYKKSGRVREANVEYYLDKTKNPKEKGAVNMADVSYISYDKAPEAVQKTWQGRIPIAPTLSIEIVSARFGLKPALRKMKKVWMDNGTDIGVVVCPFSKKIFIFDKFTTSYQEQSIYTKFTHPLLPGYEGDFSEYVDEIK